MKKEDEESTETAENHSDGKQPTASKKPAKPKTEKKQPSGVRLPFLIEFTYTISMLILIFLALAVIITSFLSGANLFSIVLRTTIALFVVGSLLLLISSQVSSGLLFATKVEQEEAQKKQEEEMKQEKSMHSVFEEQTGKAEA